jgi:hypothetical protein
MAADPMSFAITSDQGAAVEGRVLVRYVSLTSRGNWPWALVGAPVDSMLTAAGDAWSEFVLVEGDGIVYVFVAPEGMDRARDAMSGHEHRAVACWTGNGEVWINGAVVRSCTRDWGARMAPGESVRVRYVAATRMVSVVRHGRVYDLVALPATAEIAHMRFGVALTRGNSILVTGASAGACERATLGMFACSWPRISASAARFVNACSVLFIECK